MTSFGLEFGCQRGAWPVAVERDLGAEPLGYVGHRFDHPTDPDALLDELDPAGLVCDTDRCTGAVRVHVDGEGEPAVGVDVTGSKRRSRWQWG